MRKFLLLAFLFVSPLLINAQDNIDVSKHDLTLMANEAPIILHVYPTPIIDQFRIDLRDFQGQSTKIEVIKVTDEQTIYTREFTPATNSIQLSAYAIGMINEDYKVRITSRGTSFEKLIRLD